MKEIIINSKDNSLHCLNSKKLAWRKQFIKRAATKQEKILHFDFSKTLLREEPKIVVKDEKETPILIDYFDFSQL